MTTRYSLPAVAAGLTRILLGLCWIWLGTACYAQNTAVDLGRQARNFDFANAIRTRPVKTGTSLPGNCLVGELFFRTSVTTPGTNLHGCVAVDQWAPLGVGQPPLISLQLADLKVDRLSSTQLSLNASCLQTTPCNYRRGSVPFSITQPATLSIDTNSGPGNARIYLDSIGVRVVLDGQLEATCSAGCTIVPGDGFPAGSIPLFRWSSTIQQGVWDTTGEDLRGLLYTQPVDVGLGLALVSDMAGGSRIELDDATLPRYQIGSGAPGGACTAGRDTYTDTEASQVYFCVASDQWKLSSSAVLRSGLWAATPVCGGKNQGQMFWPTDSPGYRGYCDGTTWKWFHADRPVALAPAAATWTALPATTVADEAGSVTWNSASSGALQGMVKALPSAPYQITFGVRMRAFGDVSGCGALWTTGPLSTSPAHTVQLTWNAQRPVLKVTRWSDFMTTTTDDLAPVVVLGPLDLLYFRLSDDGTNRKFEFSTDGLLFETLATVLRQTPFTPTHAGLFCQGNTTGTMLRGRLFHSLGL